MGREEPSGVVVVDKPEGMTSAKAVDMVKRRLDVSKAGHAGTLDPFATGVLVCCLNQATRLAQFFLHGEKTYRGVLQLGVETDTQDATGTVIGVKDPGEVSEDALGRVFQRFRGKILQKPPVFSALKHNGTPLYKLARQGRPVQKPAREVFISAIDILEVALPHVSFEVTCSAGTYIRTLCADVGAVLGCGGHLASLRRTASSGFTQAEAVSLGQTQKGSPSNTLGDRVLPMADALRGMPAFTADSRLMGKIYHGKTLTPADLPGAPRVSEGGFIKIVDENANLCAVLDARQRSDRYTYCCVFHA